MMSAGLAVATAGPFFIWCVVISCYPSLTESLSQQEAVRASGSGKAQSNGQHRVKPAEFNILDLIDFALSDDSAVETPVVSKNRPQRRPLLGHLVRDKTLKPDSGDKALRQWLLQNADNYDWKFANKGESPQHANQWVEMHLNAQGKGRRPLAKPALWQIAAFRRGLTPNLYVRPRWSQGAPSITLRFDADAHEGETDAQDLIDRLNVTWFEGRLYTEPSTRGHSAWGVFRLRAIEGKHGTYYGRKAEINAQIHKVQDALQQWAAAQGFAAKIEVNSRFRITKENEDGIVKIFHRGGTFKVPRCRGDADVARLSQASFAMGDLAKILQGNSPTPARPTTNKKRKSKKVVGQPQIQDSHSKITNRLACLGRASREVLPRDAWNTCVSSLSEGQQQAIIDRANEIYHANALNGGERDRKRDIAFKELLPYVLHTNGKPGDRGGAGVHFGVRDLEQMEHLIRSKLSKRDLSILNNHPRLRNAGIAISYTSLAWTGCTMAKNIVTSDGYVPTSSIKGMLAWVGINTNGTAVALSMGTLMDRGLFNRVESGRRGDTSKYILVSGQWVERPACEIANPYHPSKCDRYRVLGAAQSLPFIAHLKVDSPIDYIEPKDMAAARGAEDHLPSVGSILFPFIPQYGGGEGLSSAMGLVILDWSRPNNNTFNRNPAKKSSFGTAISGNAAPMHKSMVYS